MEKRKTVRQLAAREKAAMGRERELPSAGSGVRPSRLYKDRVFRMIFREKKEYLELYNALNGTDYENPEELTVTTLENAVYLGMRNDISYLLDDRLSLYEHQSTWNPNLPLRNLFYVSNIYSELTRDENLYGSRLVKLPEPVFVVFYNGQDKMPEKVTLQLSDAFWHQSGEAALELKTQVLNINPGFNQPLMEKCRTLRDYTVFVDKVRKYGQELPFPRAVEKAIAECIEEDVLAEFLRKNRAEVLSVSIFEYDEVRHIQQERDQAREEGKEAGREEGRIAGEALFAALTEKLIRDGRMEDLQRAVRDEAARKSLYEEYGLKPE